MRAPSNSPFPRPVMPRPRAPIVGSRLIGHFRKGYGMAAMTNGENGLPVLDEIEARVAAAYDWDSLDKPVLR